MSNTFTYIIRSSNMITTTDNTNSCTIRLNCPSQFEKYDVEVDSFHVETNGFTMLDDYCEIQAVGLPIINGSDTRNNQLTTLGLFSFKSGASNSHIKFKVTNFNNMNIKFNVLGSDLALLQDSTTGETPTTANYDEPWILVLKLTGVHA